MMQSREGSIRRRGAYKVFRMERQGSRLPAAQTSTSFSIQYTALILILIAFLVGGVYRHSHFPIAQDPQAGNGVHQDPDANSLSEIRYQNVFALGSGALQEAPLEALVMFLSSHDVVARMKVFPDRESGVSTSAHAAQALGRAVVLQRYFLKRGVPSDLIQVLAFEALPPRASGEEKEASSEYPQLIVELQRGVGFKEGI